MSRLSNELTMIKLLENGRKYSIKELSEILEVSPRMIRSYKNDLELAGIYINTIRGPYGGYIMDNHIFKQNFSKYDLELLKSIKDILEKNNFEFMKEYNLFMSKVNQDLGKTSISDKLLIDESNNNLYNVLSNAIKNQLKVKIDYKSLDGKILTRIIHPCHIFNYNDSMYVAAFCELRSEIRHFEFKRIKNIILLDVNFN